jgi:hypothetical protein
MRYGIGLKQIYYYLFIFESRFPYKYKLLYRTIRQKRKVSFYPVIDAFSKKKLKDALSRGFPVLLESNDLMSP